MGQLDLANPQVVRIVEACKKLGLEPESPISFPDCVTHVGLRKQKIAFYLRKAIEYSLFTREYKKWKAHGWEMLRTSYRQLEMLTDEQVVEHLRGALREMKVAK
jgi:hypothetical protein